MVESCCKCTDWADEAAEISFELCIPLPVATLAKREDMVVSLDQVRDGENPGCHLEISLFGGCIKKGLLSGPDVVSAEVTLHLARWVSRK